MPRWTSSVAVRVLTGCSSDPKRDDSREAVGYVPAENLEGRALFRFFSTDGSAHLWEVWKWPFAIRYSRILTLVK